MGVRFGFSSFEFEVVDVQEAHGEARKSRSIQGYKSRPNYLGSLIQGRQDSWFKFWCLNEYREANIVKWRVLQAAEGGQAQ